LFFTVSRQNIEGLYAVLDIIFIAVPKKLCFYWRAVFHLSWRMDMKQQLITLITFKGKIMISSGRQPLSSLIRHVFLSPSLTLNYAHAISLSLFAWTSNFK